MAKTTCLLLCGHLHVIGIKIAYQICAYSMTNFDVTWSVHNQKAVFTLPSVTAPSGVLLRMPASGSLVVPSHALSPLPCATVCELLRSKWACMGSRRSWYCPYNPPSHSALSDRFTDMAPTASAGGSGSHGPPPPPPAKRVQVPAACMHCRRKKTKV
jgi:hypothetical protein